MLKSCMNPKPCREPLPSPEPSSLQSTTSPAAFLNPFNDHCAGSTSTIADGRYPLLTRLQGVDKGYEDTAA